MDRIERVDPYAAWRVRNYQFYAVSWFLMTIGRQIETVAIGVYVYAQTKDMLSLGWLGLVQAVPFMLMAIPGGQLADRRDRRLVLAGTLAATTLMASGLAAICHAQAQVGWVYGVLIVGAMTQALGSPARAALLPQIVPPERFANAVTWNSSVFHVGSMLGPAVGGLLIANPFFPSLAGYFGPALAETVVATLRLLALAMVLGLPARRPEPSATSISLASLMAGVRFVTSQKPILATISLDLLAVLLGGATYLLPVFVRDVLQVGDEAVGYLRSAEAAGAIFMAFVLAHLPPIRRAGLTMLWAVAGFGAAMIVFGLSRSVWLSLAAMFLAGAFDNVSVVVRHTLIQMLTPDAMRGRVSAVNNVFIVASNDLGGMESGVTAWAFGPVLSVVGGGIGTILVVLGAAWRWPEMLRIGSLANLKPVEEEKQVSGAAP